MDAVIKVVIAVLFTVGIMAVALVVAFFITDIVLRYMYKDDNKK